MKHRVLLLTVLSLALWAGVASAAQLPVFVSVLPQKYFVERIGGDLVDVSVMVMPGASPATYEPSARQMVALSKAKAYFAIGVPFETTWLSRIVDANKKMLLVRTDKGVAKRQMEAHHHEEEEHGVHHDDLEKHQDDKHEAHHDDHAVNHDDHDDAHRDDHDDQHDGNHEAHNAEGHAALHGEGVPDPHIWVSPELVKTVAANTCAGLIEVDPDNAARYKANLDAFLLEITEVDSSIRSTLADVAEANRSFMVFHPSWGYFAEQYGLKQIPIEVEGKSPSPRELAEIVEHGKELGIVVVFVQPQFSSRSAKVIATEIGARVAPLDPLAEDWPTNMKEAANVFRKELR